MAQSVIQGDVLVTGNLSASSFNAPSNSVSNSSVIAGAQIDYSKLVHEVSIPLCTVEGTAVVTSSYPVFIARTATTLVAFNVAIVTPPTTSDTITVDLRNHYGGGNTSLLSSVVTLNSATTTYTMVTGTLASTSILAGSVLEIVITATGTSGKGLITNTTLAVQP
jgi:hypothetical protein